MQSLWFVNITAAGDDIEATVSAARSFLASVPKESGHTLSSDGHFLSNFSLSRAQSADGEYSELNEALIVPTQVTLLPEEASSRRPSLGGGPWRAGTCATHGSGIR